MTKEQFVRLIDRIVDMIEDAQSDISRNCDSDGAIEADEVVGRLKDTISDVEGLDYDELVSESIS